MERVRSHVFISGRVQGVGYRFSTHKTATHLGLAGWVSNLPDGRVEAVFEGTPEQVNAIVRWCYQGPPGALVTSVDVFDEEPEGIQQFDICR